MEKTEAKAKRKKKAPWFKCWAGTMSKLTQGLALHETGLLYLVLLQMWSFPPLNQLTWPSGLSVKLEEMHDLFGMEKGYFDTVLNEILRKTNAISLNESGELHSNYLKDQMKSWDNHGRGDK